MNHPTASSTDYPDFLTRSYLQLLTTRLIPSSVLCFLLWLPGIFADTLLFSIAESAELFTNLGLLYILIVAITYIFIAVRRNSTAFAAFAFASLIFGFILRGILENYPRRRESFLDSLNFPSVMFVMYLSLIVGLISSMYVFNILVKVRQWDIMLQEMHQGHPKPLELFVLAIGIGLFELTVLAIFGLTFVFPISAITILLSLVFFGAVLILNPELVSEERWMLGTMMFFHLIMIVFVIELYRRLRSIVRVFR